LSDSASAATLYAAAATTATLAEQQKHLQRVSMILSLTALNGFLTEANAAASVCNFFWKDVNLFKWIINMRHGRWGTTRLMWASQNGQLQRVEEILALGGDIDATDNSGKTALMWASDRGCLYVVKTLCDRGADVSLRDTRRKTALSWSIENGHMYVVRALRQAGAVLDDEMMSALGEYEETSFNGCTCACLSCTWPCCCPVFVCWASLFLPCLTCDHFLCQAAVCDRCCFDEPAKDSKLYTIYSRAALRCLGCKVVPGENRYPLDLDFEPLTSRIVSSCPLICCLDLVYVLSGGASD